MSILLLEPKFTPKDNFREYLEPSCLILKNSFLSASHFYELFQKLRSTKTSGITKDTEQDLLRAMLLFSSAGLDSMVKQLVKDSLPAVIDNNRGSQKEFTKYLERKIKKQPDGKALEIEQTQASKNLMNFGLIAEILASPNPRDALLKKLVKDLTRDSLQSADQLLKVASYFATRSEEIAPNINSLKEAFEARNQISHEMDIDLYSTRRTRRLRKIKEMTTHTNTLLQTANLFLQSTEKRLERK